MEQKKKRNTLDIVGFVFGIIATVVAGGYFCWYIIDLISSISDAMSEGAFNGLVFYVILPVLMILLLPVILGVFEILKFARGDKKRKLKKILTIVQCAILAYLTITYIWIVNYAFFSILPVSIAILALWVCVILGFINVASNRGTDTPKQTLIDVKLCAYCGAKVSGQQNFCGICGKEIVNANKLCANCGKELVQGNKFCVYCGKEVIQ